jgi:7-carboxy-7-deazaguanine synthase
MVAMKHPTNASFSKPSEGVGTDSSRQVEQKPSAPRIACGDERENLFVYRIYRSIQGESSYAGLPCTFVRLAGCNLRCRWCDTPEAFASGVPMSVARVIKTVDESSSSLVEITGGEPLLQPAVKPLMRALCEGNKTVLLETSGERDIAGIDSRVRRIMDLKSPSSGESHRMRWQNIELLTQNDEVKFVLSDRDDYLWAREVIQSRRLFTRVKEVLVSCVHGTLDPRDLVGWILADGLPVRVQLQLHKYIWGPDARDV